MFKRVNNIDDLFADVFIMVHKSFIGIIRFIKLDMFSMKNQCNVL